MSYNLRMDKIISFNNNSLGVYSEEQIRKDWNIPGRVMGANSGRCYIVGDPLDSSRKVLEIKYPRGKVGQEEDGGGAQWRHKFGASYTKCTVEYKAMFPIDFDFVKGGKLPGLGGGTSPGGGKDSDGSDGFSARIMWREGGELFQYMYWMERSQEKNWGDDLPWVNLNGDRKSLKIIPGQWHTLKTKIIMNTPGERDGTVTSWLDGELALSNKGAFRAVGATFGIDNFNFTTFFGGNTPDWAPTKDEIIYFADFKITAGV